MTRYQAALLALIVKWKLGAGSTIITTVHSYWTVDAKTNRAGL
ncbi:hypothetical protein [Leptolyngbya sp. FACHB-261]|nr:hypothetical protein [Leptolyngbya sp. FACHB-261]